MQITMKMLMGMFEKAPWPPSFHVALGQRDFKYIDDVDSLKTWMSDFFEIFKKFDTELKEKLKEAQAKSSEVAVVEILKEILGE